MINPSGNHEILAIIYTYNNSTHTFDGKIFLSNSGGDIWNETYSVSDGFFKDLEFKPGSSDVVYASGRTVHKSIDGGYTWVSLESNGLPSSAIVGRIEIAVTSDDANVIYALVVNNNNVCSLFVSNDQGTSFSPITLANSICSMLSRSALAIDPFDKFNVYYSSIPCTDIPGRVHRIRSTNNGSTWTESQDDNGHHSDVHNIAFSPVSSTLYLCCDGGFYRKTTSETSWLNLSNGLPIAQVWGIGVARSNPEEFSIGLQDCGTLIHNSSMYTQNNGWAIVRDGDGMKTFIDPFDDQIIYYSNGESQIIGKSIDRGTTWSSNLTPTNVVGGDFVKPFLMDPHDNQIIYAGYHDVYRSVDGGNTFQKISSFDALNPVESLKSIAVSKSNHNVIYTAYSNCLWSNPEAKMIFRTRDLGSTWSDITSGLTPLHDADLSCVEVSADNSNILLAGFANSLTEKIMKSNDGGDNWTGFSTGIPYDIDIFVILSESGSKNIYAGTSRGVYYYNYSASQWEKYNNNLPNVYIADLAINYNSNELFAGTHGRGVWKTPLVCPTDYDLTLSGISFNGDHFYEAQHDIVLEDHTEALYGAQVSCRAEHEVHLIAPFYAHPSQGGKFHAFIHNCDAPGSSPTLRKGATNDIIESKTEKKTENPAIAAFSIFPNPGSGVITFSASTGVAGAIQIEIFNTLSEKVAIVANEYSQSGEVKKVLNGISLKPGVYYCVFTSVNRKEVKKLVISN